MREKEKTIELEFPVQLPDMLLTAVTIRRPTMKEIKNNPVKDDSDVAGEMRLMSVLTGQKIEALEMFDPDDYAVLQEAYISFRRKAE